MLGLIILLYPILELYTLYKVGAAVGVVNTLFALLAAFVLGLGIAKAQGKYILSKMQSSLSQNRLPAKEVLHGLIIFLAGILLAVPGFVSDFIAIILLLPGTRHLVAAYMKRRFEKQILGGGFKAYTFGNFGGFGGFGGSRPTSNSAQKEGEWAREVSPKVIDIAPVSKRSVQKPETEN